MSWIVTVVVIFLLLLLFLIFFVIFEWDKDRVENEITVKVQENQIEINLLNFLRTPVNEQENVADYIGYAVLEETDEEKAQTNIIYELPPSYNDALELFNIYLFEYYKPECASLKLEIIEPSGTLLKTRNINLCEFKNNKPDYSAFVLIPLKKQGNLLNLTLSTGKADTIYTVNYCLDKIDGEWVCSPFGLSPSSQGVMGCKGKAFEKLSECNEEIEDIKSRPDADSVSIGEIIIESAEEGFEGWVLCELFYGYYKCECVKPQVASSKCPLPGYSRLGDEVYETRNDCVEGAINKLKESIEKNEKSPHCANYYSSVK